MTTKLVYFTVGGRNEQAQFSSEDTAENMRELFRAAAEADGSDILKLYNVHGNLINISQRLAANNPDTRYSLEVVAAHYMDGSAFLTNTPFRPDISSATGATVAAELGFDVEELERRLEELEKRIASQQSEAPDVVRDMARKVDIIRDKLENLDHLSWLGLYKDLSSGPIQQPFWNKLNLTPKSVDKCRQVFEKVNRLCQVPVTKEVRDYLKKPSFDNWQWDDAEMLVLLRQMFIDLNFITKFNIEMPVLLEWLFEIYRHYNDVPFHNFKHCFMVAQMMYGLTWLIDLPKKIEDLDVLTLLVSAICHDLDHPGYNNAYQINARTELALRYNDISPLENHHCSIAFEILENNNCNILRNLEPDAFKRLRNGMIRCILATDMAKHHEILKNFKAVLSVFDFAIKEHKDLCMQILVKVSDISNEARPIDVAVPWLECLLQEFFNQEEIIAPVQKALEYYTDMQQALEQEKKKKEEERDQAALEGQTEAFRVVKLPDKNKFKIHTLSRSIQQRVPTAKQ